MKVRMVRQNKAQIVEQGNRLAPRRKARQVGREEMNYFGRIIHRYSPSFAALASCARYCEVRLQLAHAKSLAETLRRIKYQQRETLH
jgi:hypothetical protein